MVPAWYLAFKWEMNLYLAILVWILGSLWWAWLNYLLASVFWRGVLEKIIKKEKIDKLDIFFKKHWEITTFTWRLIPWIRQYISFPAWLAKMNSWKFTFYTWFWAWIWVIVLTLLWYFIGQNEDLVAKYLKEITIITLVFVWLLVFVYFLKNSKNDSL